MDGPFPSVCIDKGVLEIHRQSALCAKASVNPKARKLPCHLRWQAPRCTHLLGNLDLTLCDQGPGDGGAQQVQTLVLGVGAAQRKQQAGVGGIKGSVCSIWATLCAIGQEAAKL